MIDRIVSFLVVAILVLAGILLASSGLAFIMDLGNLPLQTWQTYGGWVLLSLSLLLAALNLLFTGHPLYEYWLVIIVANIIGICYLS